MKRAFIVIGLGFGDESKGATVDFLTRTHKADLCVRFSGGPQSGHNVVLPDGQSHCFSQFGAGALAGARTYLGPHMMIDPAKMAAEARSLWEISRTNPYDKLTTHPKCLVVTPYHIVLNKAKETSRGPDRYGSCGYGVGETRSYWITHGEDAIFAEDLRNLKVLTAKLDLMRTRFTLELPKYSFSANLYEASTGWTLKGLANAIYEYGSLIKLSDEMPEAETVVFEGSQGILLDQTYGFHPHTTWSDTTSRYALDLIDPRRADVTTIGVIRSYMTRHGEGPFPSFDRSFNCTMSDIKNPYNDWQGSIKFGYLDIPLLQYAVRSLPNRLDGICLTHLDYTDDVTIKACVDYADPVDFLEHVVPRLSLQATRGDILKKTSPVVKNIAISEIPKLLNAPILIKGNGPTFKHYGEVAR